MTISRPRVGSRNRVSAMWRALIAAVILVCAVGKPAHASLIVTGWEVRAHARIEHHMGDGSIVMIADETDSVSSADIEAGIESLRGVRVSEFHTGDAAAVPVRASSYQTTGGWDAAGVEAGNGTSERYKVHAEAEMKLRVKNGIAQPVPISFGFLINQAEVRLEMGNFVASSLDGKPYAAVGAELEDAWREEDAPNRLWQWMAGVEPEGEWLPNFFEVRPGSGPSYEVESQEAVTEMDGNGMRVVVSAATYTMTFNPFEGHVDLGVLAPGEEIELVYRVWARVYTGEHNPDFNLWWGWADPVVRASALIEDPFGVEAGAVTINNQPVSSLIVPEPASTLIVAAGLGVLALRRPKAAARG